LCSSYVACLLYAAFPSFGQNYCLRIEASFLYMNSAPEKILSGRVSSWGTLLQFMSQHPWQTAFGIGYKTLPYSTYMGTPITADNTYLGLLVEIGALGLALSCI
jgi:O-antigen ligase